MLNRRWFLSGLTSAVVAPMVIKASSLMPISSLKLPKLKYVRAIGIDAGTIEAHVNTSLGLIPCDGRMVNGLEWPDLFRAVRGRDPVSAVDDYIHIECENGHKENPVLTVDVWRTIVWPAGVKSSSGIALWPDGKPAFADSMIRYGAEKLSYV